MRKELPAFSSVDEAVVSLYGSGTRIEKKVPVHGGDINEASCLMLSDGQKLFLKENSGTNAAFFSAEATGLRAIEATGAIGTPRILAIGAGEGSAGKAFLLMEYLSPGVRSMAYWEIFARELAAMHRADTSLFVPDGRYGFMEDNFIGARPQKNEACERWVDFFRECRLEPQIRWASDCFSKEERATLRRLLDALDGLLIEPIQPSLLHGDLWSGNVVIGSDGKAWLIDPAVYVGHAEADLAMTELFGGFSETFYSVYREVGALQADYEDRRDLYNLYHLLNHLNLFGRSYLGAVLRTAGRYAG